MIYCLNPDCRNPQNPDGINFCRTCGAKLISLLRERYRVLNLLGTGGFGRTYLAEDTDTPSLRRCVIKQLKPIAHNHQIYQLVQERFQREAAILEQLGEENRQIPSLYAYFSVAGYFYLVQQWIDGQTLTQLVQQQVTLCKSFVRVALKSLLLVLDEVHSKGIIHRDIKPDNIILSVQSDQPVLIDFGAVKEIMGTKLNSQGSLTSSIVIETPGYMPSEQAAGRPLYSSDLYSLGLTAIYALTGFQPQQLKTDSTTGEILWHEYANNISQDLVAVLDKAIRWHPRERYKSPKDMLDALQSGTVPIPNTTPSPRPLGNPPPPVQRTYRVSVTTPNSNPSYGTPVKPVRSALLNRVVEFLIAIARFFVLFFRSALLRKVVKFLNAIAKFFVWLILFYILLTFSVYVSQQSRRIDRETARACRSEKPSLKQQCLRNERGDSTP